MAEMREASFEEMAQCVGLFGTCAGSQWRAPFKKELDRLGVAWFDPQIPNWTSKDAIVEAEHLAHDGLVIFPVTDESYATGSLAEVGFSVMQSLKRNNATVVYIDPKIAEHLKEANPLAAKESTRGRALVKAHLAKINDPRVLVAEDMEHLMTLTLLKAKELLERGVAEMDVSNSLPKIKA